jgi:hypothetical protein
MERDYTSLLPQVLSKLFPDAATRDQATRILSAYGRESFHREMERVHLGILKLSGTDLSAIEKWTQLACDDFRDLLVEAEYRLSFGKDRLRATNPLKYEALKKKESEQYDAWIVEVLRS